MYVKSLLDIQTEIRELENSVKIISESIRRIDNDIETLRGIDDDNDIDYNTIEVLARHIKFGKHPLADSDDRYACKIYIEMLLNIVRQDYASEETVERLVFIQWLQKQSGIGLSLKELLKDCYQMKTDSYYEFAELIPAKLRERFVVDALIIANIAGDANKETLEYIVDLCEIIGIEKNVFRELSLVARTALCQNIGKMKGEDFDKVLKKAKFYRYYISEDILPQRKIEVSVKNKEVINFKWEVKQGSKVKAGDIIATYNNFFHAFKEIKATSTGTIFQFKDNSTYYGVISNENDNKDSIKSWVKEIIK